MSAIRAVRARLRPVKRAAKAVGRGGLELSLYPRLVRGSRRPRVAFLVSGPRSMASLIRGYNMAEALHEFGWSTLVVPRELGQEARRRLLRIFAPDIVVVQKCRHALNRPPHLDGLRYVLDLDDADFLDPNLAAPMEAAARGACGVIAGSRFIERWASEFCASTRVIWSTTPARPGPRPPHAERRRIVTWAQAIPHHYPDDFDFVTRILAEAAERTAPFTVRFYGWTEAADDPKLDMLRAKGLSIDLRPPLPYAAFLDSLRDVSVGLSSLMSSTEFNQGKSFGKVLGYLDARVPVICSDGADHAAFFGDGGEPERGVVTNDPDRWVGETVALLDDPARRQRMSDAAHDAFVAHLSLRAGAARTDAYLREVIASAPAPAAAA